MSAELQSLDEIIKKSKAAKMKNKGSRPGIRRSGGKPGAAAKSPLKGRGGNPKSNGAIRGGKIEDARLKIIQKNRQKLGDAREKLAQIAKQSDARLKLQKLRGYNHKADTGIIRKTARNGKLSISTNKVSTRGPPSLRNPFLTTTTRSLTYRPPQPLMDAHYMDNMMMNYSNNYMMGPTSLRRTVDNEYNAPMSLAPPMFSAPLKPTPYIDWDNPANSLLTRPQTVRPLTIDRPRDYKVIPRSGLTKSGSSPPYRDEYSFTSKLSNRQTVSNNSSDSKYYGGRTLRESSSAKSRLDGPKVTRTAAPTVRPKTTAQSTGYRIVVSNLQPNVTQEDIKELFEDVGELTISRLVRPGVAEVVYKTLKDASKAVETYHNRQLDGHPMKCLLVNPKPKTSSSINSSRGLSHSRRSDDSELSLETVHRALFK